ncbi:DNA-3-methyladenine glycosylase 2 family protein [bacterium]|nr:MAG: DNA-3-methyladenine glycosylase 2 family protein [bacterium]
MNQNPEKHLILADPILGSFIKLNIMEPRKKSRRTHLESLVEVIVSQQLSVKAADTIYARFLALFPNKKFPKPEVILRTNDSKMRAAGLSYQKISYIKDVCSKVIAKEVRLNSLNRMTDEEVIAELVKIKGIGRWTAEMFLMFSLMRPDVFSNGDLGLRNAIIKLYKLKKPPTEKQLERITKKWSPHRTTASRYLWKSLNNTPNQ